MSGPDEGALLGLRHNQNRLVAYNPAWAAAFEAERARLVSALGATARSIEHYGSTAVSGLPAKPIVDILVGVLPLSDWVKCHDPLLTLGYDYAEHAGVPGHHIFGRGRDRSERTHLVHVVEFGGESWVSNLAFRDALRRDGQLRDRYLALKVKAVAAAPEGRTAYNAQKQAFIDAVKARLVAPD
ncbi:GrpB family protein [Devosia sp.]|uniref:GrpB family protein n=1 Tax=Devosia sp. TaxID=1871048 RepID=UPI001A063C30|nr:GrpB family protein [Devosia sp.]MBE0579471.1 GrpB family protein [Devosia sp.]